MARPFLAALLVLLCLGMALLTDREATPVVSAHALLERAEPPVNASLREPPETLTLYFSELLERKFSSVRVVDQNGQRFDHGPEFDESDGRVMRVTLSPASPGYLMVSWETVSMVDGHRIAGSYPLTILSEDGSSPAQPPPATTALRGDEARPGLVVARLLLLGAGCLLTGALLFMLWVSSGLGEATEPAREASDKCSLIAACISLAVMAAAALLELLVQATDIGSGVSDVLDTRWGERWLLRNLLLLAPLVTLPALLLFGSASRLRRPVAGVSLGATIGALAVLASTSHGAAGVGAFWAAVADFVHLLAASVWIGMLAMLALLFTWTHRSLDGVAKHQVLAAGLQRFSVVAVVSVALLLLTGTISAVIEVGRLDDFVHSSYGRALLVKLLLILPLLAVGGYNAYVLRPGYQMLAEAANSASRQAELESRERRLSRLIRLELMMALSVIAVVAYLVQINPTRAGSLGPPPAGEFTATKLAEDLTLTLVVDPNEPGINSFDVYLSGDGVDTIEQVRLDFFDRSGGTSESRLVLDEITPRTFYSGEGPYLTTVAEWQIRVNLRRSEGSDLSIPFDVSVGGGGAPNKGRGGALARPVSLSTDRVLVLAVVAVLAVMLTLGSLRGRARYGGNIGSALGRIVGPPGPG